jgi:hypothetical protein
MSMTVVAPMAIKERDRATSEGTGQTITLFKGVSVSDAQQIQPLPSGQPTPLQPPDQPLTGDSHAHLIAPAIAFAESLGFTDSFESLAGSAGGWCDGRSSMWRWSDTLAAEERAELRAHPDDRVSSEAAARHRPE